MKYNNIIRVNENFQYSVNLQFDINNISKINEYIPTKDGCELLKKYINSVINGKNRATTLIGPYGKGKSHLLLVLITLLDDYEIESIKAINNFLDKVKKIDIELFNMIYEFRNKKIRLMPIIINSNYNDLNQAFLLALSEALNRENLSSVIINTYFDVAIKVIEKWEKNYKDAITDFEKCLKRYGCTLKKLKYGLKNYDEKDYEIFKNVYSCILHGQEFNPLVNSDIIKTYKDLTHEITNYGFNGMFIVFDEFSKFLEYSDNTHMIKDLKLLQDFAELANRTGLTEQIHLSCITQKAMNQYLNSSDENNINVFKTVEGRLKELFFNRSIEQNYEIISYALTKQNNFEKYYKKHYKENEEYYQDIKKINIFKNIEDIDEILFKGCFPLNPITVYCLVGLSEKVAQNERTLFTFLTDDDSNSLKSFINHNLSGLFNVNKIYDYFRPIFKKENDDLIKSIWLKVENALAKTKEEREKAVIKALGIIYMLNELEILIPDDKTLRLSLNLTNKEYDLVINNLVEKSIIKRRKITDYLEFTTIYNRELSKEIKRLGDSQFYDISIKDTLNEIIPKSYAIPRRYNDEYKITRFFKNIFITENELLKLNNFDILFELNYCDGIILKLIRESRNIQKLREKFKNINSSKVVLEIPKTIFPKNIINLLKDYKSINDLQNDKDISNEEINELNLISKETTSAISEQVNIYFSKENIQEYIYKDKIRKKILNLSGYLSDLCMKVYYKTPIINNEMINKKDLSSPIKKARNIVLDTILFNDKKLIKSKTSAEATIYKAIVGKKNNKSIKDILNIINSFIAKSENKQISFKEIYNILEKEPYSIRKGIIPVLIALALYNYSDIIVLYFMNKEIDLDSINLIKINDNPSKYFIYTEKGTTDKINYLSSLMYIYNIPNLDTQRVNLKKLVNSMRKWILSLPRVLREYTINNIEYNLKKEYIEIKDELLYPDINNNEFIYNRLFEIFNTNSFENVISEINKMKNIFDNFLINYINILIQNTKSTINKDFKGTLSTLLKEWYQKNNLDNSKRIYNIITKNLIDYIKDFSTHNERDIVEKISKILTGYYIEDWQSKDYNNYIKQLSTTINEIKDNNIKIDNENSNKIYLKIGNETYEKYLMSNDHISALGKTMENNIENVINEYGESISEEEKIDILLNVVKKYM